MRKILPLGFVLLALVGCAASSPSKGWQPQDKHEMEMLIGETTIKALSQFFMQAQQTHQSHLNKQLVQPLSERL